MFSFNQKSQEHLQEEVEREQLQSGLNGETIPDKVFVFLCNSRATNHKGIPVNNEKEGEELISQGTEQKRGTRYFSEEISSARVFHTTRGGCCYIHTLSQ